MTKGIAVAGNIIMDNYKSIQVYPPHSTLTTIFALRHDLGGAVCNCAIDLAKIDSSLPISAIGLIGSDKDGDNILQGLKKFPNINCNGIHKSTATSFTDVMEDHQNHTRTFFQYRGANAELNQTHFNFNELNVDILHVGYILLLDALDAEDEEYGTVLARIMHQAQTLGIKTSIDIVSEVSNRYQTIVKPALKYTNYCIINDIEAENTTGIKLRTTKGSLNLDNIFAACENLFAAGVKDWVVIHAREGGIGMTRSGEKVALNSLNIKKEQIKSTTGAGDAFLSGTLYSAWKGKSLLEAIAMGIAASNASILKSNATDGVQAYDDLIKFYNETPKENWDCFSSFPSASLKINN